MCENFPDDYFKGLCNTNLKRSLRLNCFNIIFKRQNFSFQIFLNFLQFAHTAK